MRLGHWRWHMVIGLVVVLLAWGQATTQAAGKGKNKVIIYPEAGESIDDLKKQGIKKAEDYGSYWLVEADDEDLKKVKAKHGDRAMAANYMKYVDLRAGKFDPTEGEPFIPGHLRETAPGDSRLRLIQFKGPVLPQWLEQLKGAGKVKVVSYIPNNAYLVHVNKKAEDKLNKLVEPNGPIQWIGAYHPYYKLNPSLLDAQEGTVEVRVQVVENDETEQTLASLSRYALGGRKDAKAGMRHQATQMTIRPADLAQIAQLPGVLWIERVFPRERRDERVGLIMASRTNDVVVDNIGRTVGHGPIPGVDSYMHFLTNVVNVSTNASVYPVLDIADSGVDNGSLSPYHPCFYEPPTLLQDMEAHSFIAGWNCGFPPLPASRVAYNDVVDTDGHGTFVASMAVGYATNNDEVIHLTTLGSESRINILDHIDRNCTTNIEIDCSSATCLTAPALCCTNTILNNCVDVRVFRCEKFCGYTVDPVPWPYFLAKKDEGDFSMGLGISPFGRFGASCGGAEGCFQGPELQAVNAYARRARISNNSWGEVPLIGPGSNIGEYNILCQDYDTIVRDALPTGTMDPPGPAPLNQEFIEVFAGGNAGMLGMVGGFGDVLLTPPATAKNIITVGASENAHPTGGCMLYLEDSDDSLDISYFSSFGPTADGRFKPEIVAPGASVYGAISQSAYGLDTGRGCDPDAPILPQTPPPVDCNAPIAVCSPQIAVRVIEVLYGCSAGTSFSAPAVAGTVQLLWWYFQERLQMLQPTPAMAKAYIVNSARYLPITNPLTGVTDTLPSIAQGMGIVDLARMFDAVPRVIRDQSPARAIDTPLMTTNPVPQQTYFTAAGQSYEVNGEITDPTKPFRVTLAWTDPPGNPSVTKQLVNDLDLVVNIGGKKYKGNVFVGGKSVTGGARDELNNLESVFLPSGQTGKWSVVVKAINIAGDGVPSIGPDADQDFALVVYNAKTTLATLTDLPNNATNDSCQTAIPITRFPFTNVVNVTSSQFHNVHPSSTATRGGIDAFWVIERPTQGTVFNVDTFGSPIDTVLSVWQVQVAPSSVNMSGHCGALEELVSNNNAAPPTNFQSSVTFTASGQHNYYIVAEPVNNSLNGLEGTIHVNVGAISPSIGFDPPELDFGSQIAGTTGAVYGVKYVNNSTEQVEVQSVHVMGLNAADFVILGEACSGTILDAGENCDLFVRFIPTGTGNRAGFLEANDDATGSPRIMLMTGVGLPPAPVVCRDVTTLDFGSSGVGVSTNLSVTITNCGTAALMFTNTTQIIGPAAADFAVVPGGCSGSIPPNGVCATTVTFTPSVAGSRNATLRFWNNASGSPHQVALTGVGVTSRACLDKASLNFGNQTLETASLAQSVTVSNCGLVSLTISNLVLAGTNPGDFAVVGDTCTGAVLAGGDRCIVGVSFVPTTLGPLTAELQIADSGVDSPRIVTLTGNGVGPRPDALIKRSTAASYLGEGIYNTGGAGQTAHINNIPAGETAVVYVRIKNDGNVPDQMIIQGDGDSDGTLPGGSTAPRVGTSPNFSVKYYLGTTGVTDITSAVLDGTFMTATLAPGAFTGDATAIRMEITAAVGTASQAAKRARIKVFSSTDPTKLDVVKAKMVVP